MSFGSDLTGAPGSSGNCGNCHGGGNFNAAVQVEVLDGSAPVSSYTPGQKYTFKVTVNASNNPAGYGFQAEILRANNSNAGVFGSPPTGTQITNVSGRNIFEHSSRSTSNNWSIEWTAPAAGTGDVRIYASGNAVNADNNSSGDSPNSLSSPLTLTEGQVSRIAAIERLDLDMKIFPNPVQDVLNLELKGSETGRFQLRLFNSAGQLLHSRPVEVFTGSTTQRIDMHHLPAGHYHLQVTDGNKVNTVPVIKK